MSAWVGVHVTYAREAKRLATCDGVSADGNYTYKVAYEEAEAMLK